MKIELLRQRFDILKREYTQLRIKGNTPEVKAKYKEMQDLMAEIKHAEDEAVIEKARESGQLERASRIVSLIQVLICESNNLLGETEDIFINCGIKTDSIVLMQREYYKMANTYFNEFKKIVEKTGMEMNMFKDLDNFDSMIRVWSQLTDMPKPVSLMNGCKKAAWQANGRSQMCTKCAMRYNPETIMCKACNKSFVEGFTKGAKWLETKRIDRLMNKDSNTEENGNDKKD